MERTYIAMPPQQQQLQPRECLENNLETLCQSSRSQLEQLQQAFTRDTFGPSLEEKIEGSLQWGEISGASASTKGFDIYMQLQATLDRFRQSDGSLIKRSTDQRNFHRHMMNACLPKIFGAEWDTSSESILQRLGLSEAKINSQVVISTPRRWGKTWSVSMFVAACLYCIPGFTVIIYSVADRQSKMMMETVVSMFDTLDMGRERRVVKNSEYFIVRTAGGGMAGLQCLPGTSASTRGVGGSLIILEEAGFMKEEIFYVNVVPLLGVNGTALIGISTPPEELGNYYLKLFDCQDEEGEDIFTTIKVELVCAVCMDKGLSHCKHKVEPPPAWKSEKRRKMQEAIYAKNRRYFLREVMGVPIPTDIYVFPSQLVDAFMQPAVLSNPAMASTVTDPMGPEKAKFVFIGVDPCGGGSQSDTSFCALTFRTSDANPVVRTLRNACETCSRCPGAAYTRRAPWRPRREGLARSGRWSWCP